MLTESEFDSDVSSRVYKRQIDLLYDNQPFAIFVTAIVVILLFAFFTYSVDWAEMAIWFYAFTVVLVYRSFFSWVYFTKRKNHSISIKQAEVIYCSGIILTALVWSTMAIWLFPVLDLKGQLLLFVVILGIATAAHTTMGYRQAPIYSFTILIAISLIIGINISNFPNALALTIATVVYLIFSLRSSTIFYNNTRNMLQLQEMSINREHKLLLQREKANSANMAKSVFLSRMSHELRTPLNAILGFSELQLHDKQEPLTAKQSKRAKNINEAGKHLLSIVNDVLDFSRIEAGSIEVNLRITDICAVINESIRLLEDKAALRNIVFSSQSSHADVFVMADKIRLKQIIVNLLDNAIKYNRQGGSVTTILDVIEGDTVRLSIIDTGYGINNESVNELFRPFSRLGAENLGIDGTGIGLSLCKQLAALMKGRIGVDSRPGEGSCFWIELPYVKHVTNKQTDQLQGQMNVHSGSENKSKILLVEDNQVNCEVAVDMLEAMGVSVDVANNGQQAFALNEKNQYALILMDCEMPVMDGYEATKKIRKYENELQRSPTPIIALTAHAIAGAKEKCIDCGMDDFLSKPFSMSNLHTILNKWLETDLANYTRQPVDDAVDTTEDANLNKTNSNSTVLDYDFLRKLYTKQQKDGSNLVNNIVSIYLEQSSKLLVDLAEATMKSDVETVRTVSHALKSSSANVGALTLSELCRKVELACEQGRIEKSTLQQIHLTYSDVEKALKQVQDDKTILQS